MADNTRAKSHLNTVEATLNRRDMGSIDSVITYNSMRLFENLSSQNLFVDQNMVDKLNRVHWKLEGTSSLSTFIQDRINDLNVEKTGTPPPSRARLTAINTELASLTNRQSNITEREWEYKNLYDYANDFNVSSTATLSDLDINTSTTPVSWTATRIPLAAFLKWTAIHSLNDSSYRLCSENGTEITIRKDTPPATTFSFKINIWWQEYNIQKVKFDGWYLDFSGMKIDPALRNSPQEITLSINAAFDAATISVPDINVVCNKKFKLKLNDGTVPLNEANRGIQFENYNTTLPVWHKIWDTVETCFATNRYKIERKVLEKILKKHWWVKYNTLNDKQKEAFYQIIRKQVLWWWIAYFDNIYNVENLGIPADRYSQFKARFIADGKERNKWDNIKTNAQYIACIHNTVTEKVEDFLPDKLEHFMWTLPEETRLKSELTRFLDDIEKNKLDDDVNTRVNTDVSRQNHRMHRWPRSLLHNRDTNYMRFFSWSSTSIRWETVNIHTNTDPNSIDNPEPLKYDMNVSITWKNNISVEIKIEWTNEVIRHKSWEPSALVRKIMRDQRIKYGKARAHMWFNVYKAMIQMAKEKDISLQYRNGANHTRFVDLENWNIVVRQVDNLTTLAREDWTVIFDQEKFINLNKFDEAGNNWALRQWLDNLGTHFNLAMNQLHRQYRRWVEKRFWTLITSKSRMTLPTCFRLSPIKKILNVWDTTKFDFNTTVQSNWKNINIEFKKNKFTVNMAWLKKPLSSRDLWKILNHRQKRMRVFDGMERDMVEWIYTALIWKLRENSKINRTDFGVTDNITGNMYVLDQDWEFGMITREDLQRIWNPIRWVSWKTFGSLSQLRLSWITVRKMEEKQVKELMKNPFLMQRFVKAMNRRMWLWESIKAMFRK